MRYKKCKLNNDCPESSKCSSRGQCRNLSCKDGKKDCRAGEEVCQNNRCVAPHGKSCSNHLHCSRNRICMKEKCEKKNCKLDKDCIEPNLKCSTRGLCSGHAEDSDQVLLKKAQSVYFKVDILEPPQTTHKSKSNVSVEGLMDLYKKESIKQQSYVHEKFHESQKGNDVMVKNFNDGLRTLNINNSTKIKNRSTKLSLKMKYDSDCSDSDSSMGHSDMSYSEMSYSDESSSEMSYSDESDSEYSMNGGGGYMVNPVNPMFVAPIPPVFWGPANLSFISSSNEVTLSVTEKLVREGKLDVNMIPSHLKDPSCVYNNVSLRVNSMDLAISCTPFHKNTEPIQVAVII